MIKNAKITGTMLGKEDPGIMTCYITLDYGGPIQVFGGYTLDEYDKQKKTRIGTAYGLEFIREILEVLEVDTWEKLKGVPCRVDCEHSRIDGIGHYLEDKWFYPKKDLKDFIKKIGGI